VQPAVPPAAATAQATSSPGLDERMFRWWDYPLFALLTAANIAAVLYFLEYCLRPQTRANPWAVAAVAAPFLASLVLYEGRWLSLPLMRRPHQVPAREGWRVGVATTFVPGLEPLEMLEETVAALVALDYPHDTWVLDEGDDEQVAKLCVKLGARHFSRKHLPQYQQPTGPHEARTKYGNYNAWLVEVGLERYDLIAAFDPDHIPERDFLTRVVGYFDDPRIGYVQTAQVYYNQKASFIARGAAEETYAYYSSVQATSYALGYPIVTGCHNTHRATALREVGGFAAHEADDLLITLMYRAHGWRGVYVPERLAVGITPVDWTGYLNQQRRWARSVLDVKFRLYWRLARRLPKREWPVSFFHGLYYIHGLGTAFAIGVVSVMLASGTRSPLFSYQALARFGIVAAALQICELYRQRFYIDWRREGGLHWRAGILRYAKWPYVLLGLAEALLPRSGGYLITRKVAGGRKSSTTVLPHMFVCVLLVSAWLTALMRGVETQPVLAVVAGTILISSLVVVVSGWADFPPPYDAALRRPSGSR
jgi:cellulose synthase (UDP-forming)